MELSSEVLSLVRAFAASVKIIPRESSGRVRGTGGFVESADAGKLRVWATSATDRVDDGHKLAAFSLRMDGQTGGVRMCAGRGERASFQVGVQSTDGEAATPFTVTCTDFRQSPIAHAADSTPEVLRTTSVSLRRIAPPDALVPCEWGGWLSAASTCATSMWISIDVPTTQRAGIYRGRINLRLTDCERNSAPTTTAKPAQSEPSAQAEGTTSSEQLGDIQVPPAVTIDVLLQVRDFCLPVTPSLPLLCGLSEEIFEKRWNVVRGSTEWRQLLLRYHCFLMAYRMAPYICRWNERGADMGLTTYSCPFPLSTSEGQSFLAAPELSAIVLPMPALPDSRVSENLSTTPCDPVDPTAVTPEDVQRVLQQPYGPKALFYVYDEPTTLAQYGELEAWVGRLRAVIPDAKVLTTYYCGPKDGPRPEGSFASFLSVPSHLSSCTDVFCTSAWALGEDPRNPGKVIQAMREAAGRDAQWWSYVCMGPGDPHPNWHLHMSGGQHRAVAWRIWMEDSKGLLYWGANCYSTDAIRPTDAVAWRKGLPAGDGVLVYPGEAYNAGEAPLASVRLERALLGLQDVEYMVQHAEVFGRSATVGMVERTAYRGPRQYTRSWQQAEVMKDVLYRQLLSQR